MSQTISFVEHRLAVKATSLFAHVETLSDREIRQIQCITDAGVHYAYIHVIPGARQVPKIVQGGREEITAEMKRVGIRDRDWRFANIRNTSPIPE